jgi:carbon storage regulator CsrA
MLATRKEYSPFLADLFKLWGLCNVLELVGTGFDLLSRKGRKQRHYYSLREVSKMLVLSRKEGEQLLIGDDIVLTINRINGNRVAIGIEAPRNVRILRGELERHKQVPQGGVAAVSASMDETNIAVASKPVQ